MIISSDKEKAESFLRDIKEMIISANTQGYAIAKGRIWTNNQIEVIVGNTGEESHPGGERKANQGRSVQRCQK